MKVLVGGILDNSFSVETGEVSQLCSPWVDNDQLEIPVDNLMISWREGILLKSN